MWSPTHSEKLGVVIHNYDGNTKYGLPVEVGETVYILEKCGEWYRGYSTRCKGLKGIFPVAYVHAKPSLVTNRGPYETITSREDMIVQEIAVVLREWIHKWKTLYVQRRMDLFRHVRLYMLDLMNWRRELMFGTLTVDQIRDLKARITAKIDWGNKRLGVDLVPRINFEPVDAESISITENFLIHQSSTELSNQTSVRRTTRPKVVQRRIMLHHLFVKLVNFGCHVGAESEIFFSLFDAKQSAFFSERFVVKLTKNGMPHGLEKNVELIDMISALFTDLGQDDLRRDTYLVIQIIRAGGMKSDESMKGRANLYRRPYGCAVCCLNKVLDAQGDFNEIDGEPLKVYSCNEAEFWHLHEFVIAKQSNKYNICDSRNLGIKITCKMFTGELEQILRENPIELKGVSVTRKLGFSDIIMPGDVRNDLYFTLVRGDFDKGNKSSPKNVEVLVQVIGPEGEVLQDCIYLGTGGQPSSEFRSYVLYHVGNPRWTETIRLAIPIEHFYRSHVRLFFYHCSTTKHERKLFGFSFCRLADCGGTTIRDGTHQLCIYKCDKDDLLKLRFPAKYLDLQMNCQDTSSPSNNSFARNSREYVTVETLLCSTKLTQNADLLSLLSWKEETNDIETILVKFMNLDGEEIVKFIQDILDKLFAMLRCGETENQYSRLVFQALVFIFSLLEEDRFSQFKTVIDTYISDHFSETGAYNSLLDVMIHLAPVIKSSAGQVPTWKAYKCLDIIFKFILKSWLLFTSLRATEIEEEEKFYEDIHSLFASFSSILSEANPNLIEVQCVLLHVLPMLIHEGITILPKKTFSELLCGTVNSLPEPHVILSNQISVYQQLVLAKLECIKSIINSELFEEDQARIILMNMCVYHLRLQFEQKREQDICAEILSCLLKGLHREVHVSKCKQTVTEEVTLLISPLMNGVVVPSVVEIVIQAFSTTDRRSTTSRLLVAALMDMLRLMGDYHYHCLWQSFACDRNSLRDFLYKVFQVFQALVKPDVFPLDWMVMKMVTNNVILVSIQEFAQAVVANFTEGEDFDYKLWSLFFHCAVLFLTQPCLQLERYSKQKRDMLFEKYNDMRVLMGFQISTMWSTDSLEPHKMKFIPEMVGPFLEATLVPETELRKAILPIFFDMMDCEQRTCGNFKQVESELIDKLDLLVSENKGDHEYRELFETMLLERVKQEEPSWKENGTQFISSITSLLERLLDYRNVREGEENRNKRMSCTVNLLNFYKTEINRKEMYIRYIYKLHALHLPVHNYIEAAFTLKLHADLLSWSDTDLAADTKYPKQKEWQRKEEIYREVISLFEQGKAWEYGIPLCKELADLYEHKCYNYSNLSQILRKEAEFFDCIRSQWRLEHYYFRVGFYGKSLPLFLRNKVFIYRGDALERISSFQAQLQNEFPTAQFLKNTQVDQSIKSSDGPYIQVASVTPIPQRIAILEHVDIPSEIASFHRNNNINQFQLDLKVNKGPNSDDDIKNLYKERTTYTTSHCLPGILRWFEVVKTEVQELSPIQSACDTMHQKNIELREDISNLSVAVRQERGGMIDDLKSFSMKLDGVINAAVNGGIKRFQSAFFVPEYIQSHPDDVEYIAMLKQAMYEQIEILNGALSLHERLVSQDLRQFHNELKRKFREMKQSVKESRKGSLQHGPWEMTSVDSASSLTSMDSSTETINSTSSFDMRTQPVTYRKFSEAGKSKFFYSIPTQGSPPTPGKQSREPSNTPFPLHEMRRDSGYQSRHFIEQNVGEGEMDNGASPPTGSQTSVETLCPSSKRLDAMSDHQRMTSWSSEDSSISTLSKHSGGGSSQDSREGGSSNVAPPLPPKSPRLIMSAGSSLSPVPSGGDTTPTCDIDAPPRLPGRKGSRPDVTPANISPAIPSRSPVQDVTSPRSPLHRSPVQNGSSPQAKEKPMKVHSSSVRTTSVVHTTSSKHVVKIGRSFSQDHPKLDKSPQRAPAKPVRPTKSVPPVPDRPGKVEATPPPPRPTKSKSQSNIWQNRKVSSDRELPNLSKVPPVPVRKPSTPDIPRDDTHHLVDIEAVLPTGENQKQVNLEYLPESERL